MYRDEAIVEEETDDGRDSDESLLEFRGDGLSDNGLDVGAGVGIVIGSELSGDTA